MTEADNFTVLYMLEASAFKVSKDIKELEEKLQERRQVLAEYEEAIEILKEAGIRSTYIPPPPKEERPKGIMCF